MPLSAQIALSIIAHESSSGDLSSQMRVTPAVYGVVLGDGTGANQAQVAWSDRRTIGGSENDDIVVSSLQDDRGTISLSSVKAWYIKNTSAGDIVLGRNQSDDSLPTSPWPYWPNGDSIGLILHAGAGIAFVAPTAAGMLVDPANRIRVSGNSGYTYDIMLIGEGTIS